MILHENVAELMPHLRCRKTNNKAQPKWYKFQIPKTKYQINPKSQSSMTETIEVSFGILDFGNWSLFEICNLRLVICIDPDI